jgi:antitoxin HicB
MSNKPTVDVSRYPAEVFWTDEDEGFIAIAPDLPGSSAWGATEAEALAELRDAIVAWIEAARAAGNVVPDPSPPRLPDQFSGKYLLRMPRELHADLSRSADQQGVSLNQYLVYLLTKRDTIEQVDAEPAHLAAFTWDSLMLLHQRLSASTAGSSTANAAPSKIHHLLDDESFVIDKFSKENTSWLKLPSSTTASVN